MILQIISQCLAGPLVAVERAQLRLVLAATLVKCAISVITTVKTFNAASHEQSVFLSVTHKLQDVAWQVDRMWAITSGFNQFIALGMFIQAFWCGAKLVRDSKVEVGTRKPLMPWPHISTATAAGTATMPAHPTVSPLTTAMATAHAPPTPRFNNDPVDPTRTCKTCSS